MEILRRGKVGKIEEEEIELLVVGLALKMNSERIKSRIKYALMWGSRSNLGQLV